MGIFADFFSSRAFNINVEWVDAAQAIQLPAFSLTGFDFLFAIAFLAGLLTMNTLATVREEGEAGRGSAMEELLGNSQGVARMVNSVPGLAFAVQIPYNYVKNIPGMDVAVGVSAYQIASSTRAAATAANRSRTSAERISQGVSHAIRETVREAGHIADEGAQLAHHAARGTMHTVIGREQDLQALTRGAVLGTVRGVSGTLRNPRDLIRKAVQGIVRGAYEADSDLYFVAFSAMEAAREVADEIGLDGQDAVNQALEGMYEEAEDVQEEAQSRLHSGIDSVDHEQNRP